MKMKTAQFHLYGQERVPKRHIISVDTIHCVHPAGRQVV